MRIQREIKNPRFLVFYLRKIRELIFGMRFWFVGSMPCFQIVIFGIMGSIGARGGNTVMTSQDTTSIARYIASANEKTVRGEYDSADQCFRKAYAMADSLDVYTYTMRAGEEYVRFLHRQLRFNEALVISSKLLVLARKSGDETRMANTHNNIGVLSQAMGDLSMAAQHYIRALELAEQTKNHINQQKFNSNLASLFIDLNDKEKALYYSRKGFALAVGTGDSMRISNSLVNLACSENLNELYDDATKHLQQLIAIATAKKYHDRILDGYINLGDISVKQGKYGVALEMYQVAKGALRPSTAPDYAIYIDHGLSRCYYHLNEFHKAKEHFGKILPHIESNFPKKEVQDIYLFSADIHEKLGEYKQALTLQKKYEAIKDSILNTEVQESIHKLTIQYRNMVAEKTVTDQQLTIANQDRDLQRKNSMMILIIGVVSVAFLLGVLAFISFRQRQREIERQRDLQLLKAQMIGEEKERGRQARELHDSLSAILSAAKMHLSEVNFQPQNHEKAMLLLNQASKEVRNISHNLAPEIILQEGLQHGIDDFISRINHTGLVIKYQVIGHIARMETDFELLIYRIVQEAITNILRHAEAKHVIVQLTCEENLMTLTIEDDGIGFEQDQTTSKGIGLANLRSRVRTVNGSLNITSQPGSGTTLYMEFDVTAFNLDHKEVHLSS